MHTAIRPLFILLFAAAAGLAAEPAAAKHQVIHMVFFKWKDGVTPEQAEDIGRKLVALKDKVPGVVSLTYGRQNSPEAATKGKGFNAGLTVIFVDAAARDAYLPNADHQAVVTVLKPLLDDLVVMDYDL